MSPPRTSLWFSILDVIVNIVIIVAIVAGIRTFLVSPFQVEGNSMVDTLEHKEYIVINKLAYFIGKPERGDVVVFRPPNDESKHYVKRVIGLPGDEVILRGGSVYLRASGATEERKLDEPYLNDNNRGHTYQHPPSSGNQEEIRYSVPEGQYFLLGDNRQGSMDSRSFPAHTVLEKSIKGRVWFVLLPLSKMHVLVRSEYGL
ncbi:MAG: signal peptidase I [Candidatus Peregrinibacteria bacterium]